MGYMAVVDLEMCKVPPAMRGKYNYHQEVIQIGATIMDDNFAIIDGFDCFVKPEFGSIDSFIRNMTGISNYDVAEAESFEEALSDFVAWLPADVTMISWSMSDKSQIIREMAEKHIENERISALFDGWVDCQVMFSAKIGNHRCYGLEEALIASDIDYKGNVHNGLSDAYNTALLYKKLVTEPDFKLNSYYASARGEDNDGLTSSIGDLFAGFDLLEFAVA